MLLRTCRGAFALTVAALLLALAYRGWAAVVTVALLGAMEVSLSFDNAVLNATVLTRLAEPWQRVFLTWGIVLAVGVMRFGLPVLLVAAMTGSSPAHALALALANGPVDTPGSYAFEMRQAHPAVAAFGGAFLLMIVLDFLFDPQRDLAWLTWVERPLARLGRLETMAPVVTLAVLVVAAQTFARPHALPVLTAGVCAVLAHLVVGAVSDLLESRAQDGSDAAAAGAVVLAQTGRAALASFVYLEVLDSSMSFDGVIGAFAITVDPILIALGLGLVGAPYVRALTVYLVRQKSLTQYAYLEHGAHWAIGALAATLFVSISTPVPEAVTGLLGVGFIGAALASSVVRNRRLPAAVPVPA